MVASEDCLRRGPWIQTIHLKPEYDYDLLKYLTFAHTFHFSLETLTDVMDRRDSNAPSAMKSCGPSFGPQPSSDASTRGVADLLRVPRVAPPSTSRFKRLDRTGRRPFWTCCGMAWGPEVMRRPGDFETGRNEK